MKYNTVELAERYKITEAEVEAKISEWKKQAKIAIEPTYKGTDIDGFIESLLTSSKISAIFMPSGYEYAELQIQQGNADFVKYNAIVLGVSPTKDLNDFNKREITMEWWNGTAASREQMELDGKVEVRISKKGEKYPVAIDTLEKFQNGNDNPNYGKELAYKPSRNVAAIIDGKFVVARGDLASPKSPVRNVPRLGCKSTLIGHVVNDIYKIYHDAYVDNGVFEEAFDVAEPIVMTSPQFVALDQLENLPEDKFTTFVSVGEVWRVGEIERDTYGKPVIAITVGNDNLTRGIKMKAKYQPTIEAANSLLDGQKVIVVGERRYFTDKNTDPANPEKVFYIQLWGVIAKVDDARATAQAALTAAGI